MKWHIRLWNKFLNRINPKRRERILGEIMRTDQELGLYGYTDDDYDNWYPHESFR
jgi:hypothetical protein